MMIEDLSPLQISFDQISEALYEIALVASVDTAQLANDFGIVFSDDSDDLGERRLAVVKLLSGLEVGIYQYKQDSTPASVFSVSDSVEDVTTAANEIMRLFRIESGSVLSFHPEFRFRECRVVRQDDNGVRYVRGDFQCKADAEIEIEKLSRGAHKQEFWIETGSVKKSEL